MEAPGCPVCNEIMTVPIFQCQFGHSLCNACTTKLIPPICPICRQTMTQMRNWQLEDLVSKAVVPCSNKALGCIFKVASMNMEDHLKECIFREMACPLGKVFGTCSWSGKLKEMMTHFKECHPENCYNVNISSDITINNISISTDCRRLYLIQNNKQCFFLSFKIDTVQKMGYWLVQYVGTNKNARQSMYEIHVNCKQNEKRKVIYKDHCFSDAIDANEVFLQANCAVMPLNLMRHFLADSKITFSCFIKRMFSEGKPHLAKDNQSKSDASASAPKKGPAPNINRHKSPGPRSSRAKGPRTDNTPNASTKKGLNKNKQQQAN